MTFCGRTWIPNASKLVGPMDRVAQVKRRPGPQQRLVIPHVAPGTRQ